MKKGKTARIIGFSDSKVSYGTVDSKNFKSVYLNYKVGYLQKKIMTSGKEL